MINLLQNKIRTTSIRGDEQYISTAAAIRPVSRACTKLQRREAQISVAHPNKALSVLPKRKPRILLEKIGLLPWGNLKRKSKVSTFKSDFFLLKEVKSQNQTMGKLGYCRLSLSKVPLKAKNLLGFKAKKILLEDR